ncbi:MAG: LAGLIDADG family homing endonuclease [Patescibacteria group bacterium]
MFARNIVDTKWRPDLAYIIGLIATDGSLSIDGRHISLTSKDKEQLENFSRILSLKNTIGTKFSSYKKEKKYYVIQFGSVSFYRFLLSLGLTPNKTKTIGKLKIPRKYFRDFLRGHLDGDGCTYSYWDPRWKSSFMLYTDFVCASREHLEWVRDEIKAVVNIEGRITFAGKSTYHLRLAKKHSIKLFQFMYYKKGLPCLERKRLKFQLAVQQATMA